MLPSTSGGAGCFLRPSPQWYRMSLQMSLQSPRVQYIHRVRSRVSGGPARHYCGPRRSLKHKHRPERARSIGTARALASLPPEDTRKCARDSVMRLTDVGLTHQTVLTAVEAVAAESRNIVAAHDTMLPVGGQSRTPSAPSAPLKPAVAGRSAHRPIGQRRPATRSGSPLLVSIGF